MKRKFFNLFLISIVAIFAACTSKTGQVASESASAAAGEQMLASDDYDSTALAKKGEAQQPAGRNYTANSSAEFMALLDKMPDGDKYRTGILPRMSGECLEYAVKLLNSDAEGFLIVDKETMQVCLYDRYGHEKFRAGIACGKNYGTKHGKGDCRTPEGFFSIENIYDSTDWLYRDDNGHVSPVKGQFGPRFMRLKIPGTRQIGIHGTRAPGSIGRRCSHGCIRVTNDNILALAPMCKAGFPVIVSPSRKDAQVNANEGNRVPWVSVGGASAARPEPIPQPVKETAQKPVKAAPAAAAKVASDTVATSVKGAPATSPAATPAPAATEPVPAQAPAAEKQATPAAEAPAAAE